MAEIKANPKSKRRQRIERLEAAIEKAAAKIEAQPHKADRARERIAEYKRSIERLRDGRREIDPAHARQPIGAHVEIGG